MTQVPTARGTVDSAHLGRTLMHEHVIVLTPDVRQNHHEWDEEARVADLPALRERGVTDEQIDRMLVANPRRYFENVGTY